MRELCTGMERERIGATELQVAGRYSGRSADDKVHVTIHCLFVKKSSHILRKPKQSLTQWDTAEGKTKKNKHEWHSTDFALSLRYISAGKGTMWGSKARFQSKRASNIKNTESKAGRNPVSEPFFQPQGSKNSLRKRSDQMPAWPQLWEHPAMKSTHQLCEIFCAPSLSTGDFLFFPLALARIWLSGHVTGVQAFSTIWEILRCPNVHMGWQIWQRSHRRLTPFWRGRKARQNTVGSVRLCEWW